MTAMQDYIKKDALIRLNRAKGHLEHVIKMVQAGKYCIDILQQSLAVQSALKSVDHIILKGHLEEHVSEAIKGKNKGKSIQEVIDVFDKARK